MPNRKQKPLRQIMAENLRVLRLARHISQEELAELCGLHRTYISDICLPVPFESGKTNNNL